MKILNSLAALALTLAMTAAQAAEPVRMQAMRVGRVELDVPSNLQWKEEKGVLMGQSPGSYDVLMSISVHSAMRDGKLLSGIGPKIVAAQARDAGVSLEDDGSRVWYQQYHAPSADTKEGAAIHDWFVGFDAHAVTITCVVDRKAVDTDEARAILGSVPQMMRSVRTAQ